MGKFDYDAPAELFAGVGGMRSKGTMRYLRFDSAAEAIQHVIERIPVAQRGGSVLEVGEERYEGAGIQKLYASAEYPLARSDRSVSQPSRRDLPTNKPLAKVHRRSSNDGC
jgi:hypothetical protein